MRGVHYEEIEARSALNRVQGMSFRWSLNPYQGCVHGCHYCYARRYHGFLELDASEDFPSVIFVKTNLAALLRQELRRPSWVGEQVAVGTATDPYQPIEGRYKLTRKVLKVFLDHRNPVGMVTKGTLIVRDIDLLADLARGPGVSVCFSLSTLNQEKWRQLEPGTAPPRQRLRAMRRLSENGVRAGVLLAPVVPGLTDNFDELAEVVSAAADNGARFLGAKVLYLQSGTREHFMDFLRTEHPTLIDEYRRLFPGPYAPKRYRKHVEDKVADLKSRYNVIDTAPPPKRAIQQLTFLDH